MYQYFHTSNLLDHPSMTGRLDLWRIAGHPRRVHFALWMISGAVELHGRGTMIEGNFTIPVTVDVQNASEIAARVLFRMGEFGRSVYHERDGEWCIARDYFTGDQCAALRASHEELCGWGRRERDIDPDSEFEV